jgi:hypothetical protein
MSVKRGASGDSRATDADKRRTEKLARRAEKRAQRERHVEENLAKSAKLRAERALESALPEIIGPDERRSRISGFRAFFYDVKLMDKTFIVIAYVDEKAFAARPTSLPRPLRENVETLGRAVVEASVRDRKYPKRIFVDESGTTPHGEHHAWFLGTWLIRLCVGAAFGYIWTRILAAIGVPEPALGWLLAIVPIWFKQWLGYLYPLRTRLSRWQ